uniref:MH2 domain-containing protein n=1 Tax=Panagrolaimus sp. ES5 TaxID=591445 RepID=A0AC34FMR3_9BILA
MYYEYSEKVGETYKSSATEISITGFGDSSNNFRLNLGSIAKPNRNASIRHVRENIREGAKFYNLNGDVFIDCLSSSPIFVQAPLYAHFMGQHLATVYRIAPGKQILRSYKDNKVE